jgi:lipid A 3-O-deacylase
VIKGLIVAACLLLVGIVHAVDLIDGITVGWGQSSEAVTIFRFSLKSELIRIPARYEQSKIFVYYEPSLNYWVQSDKEILAAAFSPVFGFQVNSHRNHVKPYAEVGVGLSWISNTQIGGRNLSSSFQFEDRVGVGVRINQTMDFNIRLLHYSNAGLKKPNAGLTILLASLTHNF